jgi:Ca2+-binding RTX toxin-like protein
MPTTTINPVFDGSTDVERLPGQSDVEWFGGFMGYYSVFEDTANQDLQANVSFSGSGWTVAAMRFGADFNNTTTIRDIDNGTGRRVDLLQLGYNSDVELTTTRVRYILGWEGQLHDITLGQGTVFSVNVYADVNKVTTGSGYVSAIHTHAGSRQTTDTITVGSGDVGLIDTGAGRDTINVGANHVELVRTGDHNDTVNVGSGSVKLARTGDGNDTVNIASGWIEAVSTGEGNDTVNLGSGGAEVIRTGDDDDTVTTGTGYVELISTGDGNDTVNMGTGGGGFVRLGSGDDLIRVSEMNPDYGLVIQGGSGNDTIDFSAFSTGVTFTLDTPGAFQNVGDPNGDLSTPVNGYFSESSIENIIGTNNNDRLTGDHNDNRLQGGGGRDELNGGDGNDRLEGGNGSDDLNGGKGKDVLIGGRGNDRLTGDNGNDLLRGNVGDDTFVFGPNSGKDRIADFDQGSDTIEISGHAGGFAGLSISTSGTSLVVTHDGGQITLLKEAGTVLTASDFDFV